MKKLFLFSLCFLFAQAAQAQLTIDFNSIIGGTEINATDPIASTTVLLVGKEASGAIFLCTGSIISNDLILTAAHCTGNKGDAEMAAVFRLSISGTGPIITIADREVNSEYFRRAGRLETDWHDLAVLRLAQPIPAGYAIAKLQTNKFALRRGTNVILAGYGMTVPLAPKDSKINSGSGTLRKVNQVVINPNYGSTEFLISLENEKGSCHGDSGGPATLQVGKEFFVSGVASRMTENDRVANNNDQNDFSCSKEMVYTSVAEQGPWIKAAAEKITSRKR